MVICLGLVNLRTSNTAHCTVYSAQALIHIRKSISTMTTATAVHDCQIKAVPNFFLSPGGRILVLTNLREAICE